MQTVPLPADLLAPGIARRLASILAALAALIAHAFLRNPRRVGIINRLWTRINRTAKRFARLMARLHDQSHYTPPPPLRPTLPLCPRLRDRWPWVTLPIADPA